MAFIWVLLCAAQPYAANTRVCARARWRNSNENDPLQTPTFFAVDNRIIFDHLYSIWWMRATTPPWKLWGKTMQWPTMARYAKCRKQPLFAVVRHNIIAELKNVWKHQNYIIVPVFCLFILPCIMSATDEFSCISFACHTKNMINCRFVLRKCSLQHDTRKENSGAK